MTYFFSLVLLAVRRNNFGQFPKMGRTTHSAFSFLEKIMRVFKKNKGEGSEGQQRIFHKFPSFSRPGVTDSRRKPSRVFSKFRTSQQFFISHHHKFVGLIHNLSPRPPNFPKTKNPKTDSPPKRHFIFYFFLRTTREFPQSHASQENSRRNTLFAFMLIPVAGLKEEEEEKRGSCLQGVVFF